MAFWSAIPVVGKILDGVINIVDKSVEDKDEANRIKATLEAAFKNADLTEFTETIKAQSSIILGEVQGESWLQRNWRPILMLSIVAIVINNWIFFPYLSMFTTKAILLDLPADLYQLMKIGVGGYIVGRSGEKIVERWKNGK